MTKTTRQPAGRTVASSPQIAGAFVAEKRAEGFDVEVRSHGSDSKRGTRPWFEIIWYDAK
jgi:hypothetical protein